MFKKLIEINSRPAPFQFYTADELWTNEHTSKQMLEYHLNESIDVSSRNIEFIERSVAWIAAHFGVTEKTKIADFGCGPGLYTTKMAALGAGVTGIDFSANSIKYAKQVARQKNLTIDYIHKNYLDYETTERFDLITMIMCDFCALSPAQRTIVLSKFHSILKPGGSVLLDVYSLRSFEQKEESAIYELNQLDGFWSPEDYYCFVNRFKYGQEKITLEKYTIIEAFRTRVVYNWLQYFSKKSLSEECEENGFQVAGFFSDVSGTPYSAKALEFAVVLMKDSPGK